MNDQPRFFLDRGVGSRILADGLRAAGWSLVTMDERYGRDVSMRLSDVDWIADASMLGEAILCKDRQVARNPLEAQTIHMHDARVFVVARQQITGADMLHWVLSNEAKIVKFAASNGPFVCGVYEDKIKRLELKYP